jgi:hypothetical protein
MFTSALFRIESPHYRLSEFQALAAAVGSTVTIHFPIEQFLDVVLERF